MILLGDWKKEAEDGSCRWMGDRYEVTRVEIECEGGGQVVEGCCFVFCADENELEGLRDDDGSWDG